MVQYSESCLCNTQVVMATINVSPSTTVEKPNSEVKEFDTPEDPDAGLSDEERKRIVRCSKFTYFL